MKRSMDLISLAGSGATSTLRFEQPERRNALSVEVLEAFIAALKEVAGDDQGAILRLEGAGTAFCAGIDLDAGREDPAVLERLLELLSDSMRLIRAMPRVVVAQVQGAAIAGGCALLSACDFTCVRRGRRSPQRLRRWQARRRARALATNEAAGKVMPLMGSRLTTLPAKSACPPAVLW